MKRYDVHVRGLGIVGRSLALSLAHLGLRVALQPSGPLVPRTVDVRAYALNAASVGLLETLRVWSALPADAATPVYDMQVKGDAPGAVIDFSAYAQQVRELAWIVDAAALETALADALRFAPNVSEVAADATVEAGLLAVAEGKSSALRDALGVAVERHDYGQTAIAARLVAAEPHQGRALQWFNAPDVLALLPFDRPQPKRSYALVWSLPTARAEALMAADRETFVAALNDATGNALGLELGLEPDGERAAWPLSLARAERWSGPGWVLLGDAAHVVHPLAGQGLNLGLGDVLALTRVIAAREAWREPGDEKVLRRYARERETPTREMSSIIDGLWQLFASESPALRELRNRGLGLVNHLSPVKRWLTARALDH